MEHSKESDESLEVIEIDKSKEFSEGSEVIKIDYNNYTHLGLICNKWRLRRGSY